MAEQHGLAKRVYKRSIDVPIKYRSVSYREAAVGSDVFPGEVKPVPRPPLVLARGTRQVDLTESTP